MSEDAVMNAIGGVLQFAGLLVTAYYLFNDWRGRRKNARSGSAQVHVGWQGTASGFAPPVRTAPFQDQIDKLVELVGNALGQAATALAQVDNVRQQLEAERDKNAAALEALESRLRRWVRDESASRVPGAAIGLGLTAAGVLLQIFAPGAA